MNRGTKHSLHDCYPNRFVVPLLVMATMGLLVFSFSQPFMESEKFFFINRQYSLLQSIHRMWERNFHFLAVVVFVFSVIFPLLKLFLILVVWFKPFSANHRERMLSLTSNLGKWSMLDVFVTAVLVVAISARAVISIHMRIGIFLFTAAIILSILLSLYVERAARRAPAHRFAVPAA